jgi:hypothetical protein
MIHSGALTLSYKTSYSTAGKYFPATPLSCHKKTGRPQG